MPPVSPRLRRWHRRLDHWARSSVLLIGLTGICLISDPGWRAAAHGGLELLLLLCLAIFAAETVRHVRAANAHGGARHYLLSWPGVVDLLAILPVPIGYLSGLRSPEIWLLGALWILRPTRESAGLRQFAQVFVAERRALGTVATLFLVVLGFGAIALYGFERSVQPGFDTVPKALWWAVVTLTTTGYGDVVPLTGAGRMVAGMMMICGICIFGLFAGIIATGFAAENRREDFLRNLSLVRGVPFLRVLGAPGLAELARLLRRIEVPEHTTIFRRGDRGDCMFFVVFGDVSIDVPPEPVILSEGTFFGEMALLSGRSRSATAIAISPCTLLMLDAMDFHTLTAHHPELAKAVAEEARRRSEEVRVTSE